MLNRYILNQFFYDFKRALRSKTMIIITIIITLLGSSILTFITSPNPAIYSLHLSYAIYQKDLNYAFLGYAFNAFGDPLQGAVVKIELFTDEPSSTNANNLFSQQLTTNSSGFASITIPNNPQAKYIRVQFNLGGFSTSQNIPIEVVNTQKVLLFSPINRILDSSNSSRYNILIFYVDENGSKPSDIDVYASSHGSDYVKIGTLNDYVGKFKIGPQLSKNSILEIQLRKGSKILANGAIFGNNQNQNSLDVIAISAGAIAGILSLLIPLLVILAAYNLYGKDKINGVLDFILSLPITRTMLGLSRYISILLMTFVAIVLSLGFQELLLYIRVNQTFPLSFFIDSVIGLLVGAAALLGISMTLSHLLKSTGSLLAISIVIWIVFGLFWNTIIFIISFAFGIQPFSKDFISLLIQSYFVNPISFYALLSIYVTGKLVTLGSIPFNPADFGVTLLNITITGIAWTLIPFLIYYILLKKKD